MTSEIQIQILEDKNKTDEEELGNFRGTMGPLEDEIHIRKFYEKHKNTPLFNGAFKNCRINGIASQKDTQRYNDWLWRSFNTFALSSVLSFSAALILNETKFINITDMKSKKAYLPILGVPAVITLFLSYYKYTTMKHELDRKYTPIYMKSRGKL